MRQKGSVLFVRCTAEEAVKVRNAARQERRTLSGYILNAVLTRIEVREKLQQSAAPGRPRKASANQP